jgi:hypothetical protein
MKGTCVFPLVVGVLFVLGHAIDLFDRDLAKEPPRVSKDARFDLTLDLSGQWRAVIGGRISTDQWIWQECLEVTISGNASTLEGNPIPNSNGPMHHHIANGEYITFDDTQTTKTGHVGYLSYKSIIAAPTGAEAADGATAVLVLYEDTTMPDITQPHGTNPSKTSYHHAAELAIRYIDSKGRLVFQQNAKKIPGAFPLMKYEKYADVPCKHPWAFPPSGYCAKRTQVHPDKYNAFTPACCGDGYGGSTAVQESIAHPKWAQYTADCAAEVGAIHRGLRR